MASHYEHLFRELLRRKFPTRRVLHTGAIHLLPSTAMPSCRVHWLLDRIWWQRMLADLCYLCKVIHLKDHCSECELRHRGIPGGTCKASPIRLSRPSGVSCPEVRASAGRERGESGEAKPWQSLRPLREDSLPAPSEPAECRGPVPLKFDYRNRKKWDRQEMLRALRARLRGSPCR